MRQLLPLFFAASAIAEPSHTALVWQGFSHRYAAGSRRAGDYIRAQSCADRGCTATMGHAASWFVSYYAQVSSPDVQFVDGEADIELRGSVTRVLSVALPASMSNAVVLLNGFALDGDVDKLRQLDLDVGEAVWEAGRLRFTLRVAFAGKPAALKVFYLIAAGGDFRGDVPSLDEATTSFDATADTGPVVQIHVASLPPAPQLARSVMGMKRLRVIVDSEHPIGAWDQLVRKSGYDPANGALHYVTDMLWKGAGQGRATLQMEPMVLRFRDACVRDFDAPRVGSRPISEEALAFGSTCAPAVNLASTGR